MVEKNKGKAPEKKTKKKSNTEPVQQGFRIFYKYIDRQVCINDAIKNVFGTDEELGLNSIKLAIGGSPSDYVTVGINDLIKYNVAPTLTGLMDFVNENDESILGFLDCEYISEEGNVIYLSCGKKDVSKNIRSIKLNGNNYPCYMIPTKKLLSGVEIELEMGNDPLQGLGNLYVSSTDGFVGDVELSEDHYLKCIIEAAVEDATTEIYSIKKPKLIVVGGLKLKDWEYNEKNKIITLKTSDIAEIEIILK